MNINDDTFFILVAGLPVNCVEFPVDNIVFVSIEYLLKNY